MFGPDVIYSAGDAPRSVAIGDLDGDGDADLAVANWLSDDVSVLLNQCRVVCEGDAKADGLVDGFGGVEDFETFVLPGGFTNITSATWLHTGEGTLLGVFALDNIVVPQPGTLSLVAIGALGVIRRCIKRTDKARRGY